MMTFWCLMMVIMMSTIFLPTPLSFIPAILGSALADLAGGFAEYIPFTIFVKATMVLWFIPFKNVKKDLVKYTFTSLCAEIFSVLIYFLADWFLHSKAAAFASLPGNLGQMGASIILFVLISFILEKNFEIKKK